MEGTDSDDASDGRARRHGGTAHLIRRRWDASAAAAGLRPERADLRPEHADEPDPGDGRRHRHPAGAEPVRVAALRAAVQARHLRQRRTPLNFQVGYYTAVAGLGRSPSDVVINGSVDVYNQCDGSGCVALNNFWRSLSNLTINVTNPDVGCYTGEFWAVSQAAPMRRVHVNGLDHPDGLLLRPVVRQRRLHRRFGVRGRDRSSTARSSSGWSGTATSTAGPTASGTRCSRGSSGAPAQCFPAQAPCGGPYTTLATSPVTREAPYLYVDADGQYNVFVPAVQHNSAGTTWAGGPTPGTSIPIDRVLRRPADRQREEDQQGAREGHEPDLHARRLPARPDDQGQAGRHRRARARLPDARPDDGQAAMTVADVKGVEARRADVRRRPEELAGPARGRHQECPQERRVRPDDAADVFFRIGGATPGKATTSLVVNSDDVILDDIWAWRADHGNGVGWTANTADTGADRQRRRRDGLRPVRRALPEVRGRSGTATAARSSSSRTRCPTTRRARPPGWRRPVSMASRPSRSPTRVTSFHGYGMGSYSFFNQGVDIFAANAFEVPDTPARGQPPRSADDLPRCEHREGRHPERRQRHGRVVDHRQPGRAGHRRRATRDGRNRSSPRQLPRPASRSRSQSLL